MAYNYIITSDDIKAAQDKIEEIRKSVDLDFDETKYDLDEEGIYSVIDELTTISLFDNPKFIVVKSSEALLSASEKALNELFMAMNDINSQNVLILLFMTRFDYSNEIYQKLKRYASVIDVRIKNIPLDEYIKTSLSKEGYEIESNALSLFLSYDLNLSSIRECLEQLKCYKMDNKLITDSDIKLMIARPLDDNVYQLVEAVIQNDKKRMIACFNDMKLQSMQASFLVSLLLNKFQELYNVSILAKANTSQADIATLFNVSAGRAYYMIKNAKGTNISFINRNLDLLNDLDYKIKTGKIEQNLGLELYFLSI